MRFKVWGWLVLVCFVAGCLSTTSDSADELAAEQDSADKADGSWETIYGDFVNPEAEPGELSFLRLIGADAEELPSRYYEGAYELEEASEDGPISSSGFFNMYAYSGDLWIRFLDSEADAYVTTFERYEILLENSELFLQGDGTGPTFTMGSDGSDTSVDRDQITGVTCTLSRLDSTPQGAADDGAGVAFDGEDFAASEGLEAFSAHYSFDMQLEDDQALTVYFFENDHHQDEVGDLYCEIPGFDPEAEFCHDTIEVNRNLGTENDERDYVHAFDFVCRFDAPSVQE